MDSQGNKLIDSIKSLIVALFKILVILFAGFCKLSGMILVKLGEAMEKMVSR